MEDINAIGIVRKTVACGNTGCEESAGYAEGGKDREGTGEREAGVEDNLRHGRRYAGQQQRTQGVREIAQRSNGKPEGPQLQVLRREGALHVPGSKRQTHEKPDKIEHNSRRVRQAQWSRDKEHVRQAGKCHRDGRCEGCQEKDGCKSDRRSGCPGESLHDSGQETEDGGNDYTEGKQNPEEPQRPRVPCPAGEETRQVISAAGGCAEQPGRVERYRAQHNTEDHKRHTETLCPVCKEAAFTFARDGGGHEEPGDEEHEGHEKEIVPAHKDIEREKPCRIDNGHRRFPVMLRVKTAERGIGQRRMMGNHRYRHQAAQIINGHIPAQSDPASPAKLPLRIRVPSAVIFRFDTVYRANPREARQKKSL